MLGNITQIACTVYNAFKQANSSRKIDELQLHWDYTVVVKIKPFTSTWGEQNRQSQSDILIGELIFTFNSIFNRPQGTIKETTVHGQFKNSLRSYPHNTSIQLNSPFSHDRDDFNIQDNIDRVTRFGLLTALILGEAYPHYNQLADMLFDYEVDAQN